MDIKEEQQLDIDPAKHWYYISKGAAVRKMLCAKQFISVLDVGAGSGIFSKQLLENDLASRATCIDIEYSEDRDIKYQDKTVKFRQTIPQTEKYDLLLMMDVLEHVDDDLHLLNHYKENIENDGYLLITVPAFQFLWSEHDDFLEHRRRYTKSKLIEVVEKAGLSVVNVRYFFGILFPLVALIRITNRLTSRASKEAPKSSLKSNGKIVSSALLMIHKIETKIILPWNTIAGLSVICLCKKTQQTTLSDEL